MRFRAIADSSLCSAASHSFKNTLDRMEVLLSSTLGQYISIAFFCCSLTTSALQLERIASFRRRLDLVLRLLHHRRGRSTRQASSALGFELRFFFMQRRRRRRSEKCRSHFQHCRFHSIRTGQSFFLPSLSLAQSTIDPSLAQNIFVVGSLPALGNWNPASAIPLSYDQASSSSSIWKTQSSIRIPASTKFEYKVRFLSLCFRSSIRSDFPSSLSSSDERRTVRSPGRETPTDPTRLLEAAPSLSTINFDSFCSRPLVFALRSCRLVV